MMNKDVTITVVCEPELIQVRGHFAYDTEQENREAEEYILSELDSGNQWAWCSVKVIAEIHGLQGESSWLGCCSYPSEKDFRRAGDYFDDLQEEALDDLRKKIAAVQGVVV